MKSMFDIGFRPQFMPIPLRRPGLGQDEGGLPGAVFEQDLYTPSSTPTESYPGMYTSVDQGPPAQSYPGMYTSVDQGPPAESVPGLVTQKDLQESLKTPSQSTDWGKLAQALVAGAAGSYAAHEKAQAAFDNARAKAGLPPMPLKTAATGGSGISPNVIFLVGGIAAAAIIAVIAAA